VAMHFYFVSSHQAINESHIIKSLLRTTERDIVVLFNNRVIPSRFFLFSYSVRDNSNNKRKKKIK